MKGIRIDRSIMGRREWVITFHGILAGGICLCERFTISVGHWFEWWFWFKWILGRCVVDRRRQETDWFDFQDSSGQWIVWRKLKVRECLLNWSWVLRRLVFHCSRLSGSLLRWDSLFKSCQSLLFLSYAVFRGGRPRLRIGDDCRDVRCHVEWSHAREWSTRIMVDLRRGDRLAKFFDSSDAATIMEKKEVAKVRSLCSIVSATITQDLAAIW